MRQHIYKEYDCGLLKDPQKYKIDSFPTRFAHPLNWIVFASNQFHPVEWPARGSSLMSGIGKFTDYFF